MYSYLTNIRNLQATTYSLIFPLLLFVSSINIFILFYTTFPTILSNFFCNIFSAQSSSIASSPRQLPTFEYNFLFKTLRTILAAWDVCVFFLVDITTVYRKRSGQLPFSYISLHTV